MKPKTIYKILKLFFSEDKLFRLIISIAEYRMIKDNSLELETYLSTTEDLKYNFYCLFKVIKK